MRNLLLHTSLPTSQEAERFYLPAHLENVASDLVRQYKMEGAHTYPNRRYSLGQNIFVRWLREFVPDTIRISKGAIMDGNLRKSREFDVILHVRSSMPKLFNTSGCRYIPLETVVAVLDIKPYLLKQHVESFSHALAELNSFKRHLRPATTEEPLPILGGILAFEAPKKNFLQRYFSDIESPANFSCLAILQGSFWTQVQRRRWQCAQGTNVMAHFVLHMIPALREANTLEEAEPNFDVYLRYASHEEPEAEFFEIPAFPANMGKLVYLPQARHPLQSQNPN